MKCRHVKREGALGLKLKWCDICAKLKAGPKPKPTFETGWYAIARDMDDPGRITRVRIIVIGQATDYPSWTETVQIQNGYDTWEGPADHVIRLVAAKGA